MTEENMQCVCGGRLGGTGSSVRWCDRCGYHEDAARKIFKLEALVYNLKKTESERDILQSNIETLTRQLTLLEAENVDLKKTLETIRIEYERLNAELERIRSDSSYLAASSCHEMTGDDYGNPTCGIREELQRIKSLLKFYMDRDSE